MGYFIQALGLVLSVASVLTAASPLPALLQDSNEAPTHVKRSSCTFTSAAAAIASKKSCSTITLDNIEVPAGITLDLTGLVAGTKVIFEGKTTFGYEQWSGPLISVSGSDITVNGASGSTIDGGGARWWDGEGSNGKKTKPKFFSVQSLTGKSTIENLSILNTPIQAFSIDGCTGLTLSNISIDNSAGDSAGGHNTDGFDVADSTDITISNAIVQNQDDCLAINSGTSITFTGGTCSGGHGLSIGSVGGRSDNTVSDVTISSSTIKNSQNGVRVKTVSGATGSVSGVTYKDITLSGITNYGIVIEQDYENGGPTGTPTSGVLIKDLTLSNIKGSVSSSGTDIYILCGSGSCSDWSWSGISVSGGKKSSSCKNVPSGASC